MHSTNMRCFERLLEWFVMNGNIIIPGKASVSVYSTAMNAPRPATTAITEAQRAADWGA